MANINWTLSSIPSGQNNQDIVLIPPINSSDGAIVLTYRCVNESGLSSTIEMKLWNSGEISGNVYRGQLLPPQELASPDILLIETKDMFGWGDYVTVRSDNYGDISFSAMGDMSQDSSQGRVLINLDFTTEDYDVLTWTGSANKSGDSGATCDPGTVTQRDNYIVGAHTWAHLVDLYTPTIQKALANNNMIISKIEGTKEYTKFTDLTSIISIEFKTYSTYLDNYPSAYPDDEETTAYIDQYLRELGLTVHIKIYSNYIGVLIDGATLSGFQLPCTYNSESEIRIMIILNTLLKTGVCYGYRNGVLGDKKNFTYTFTPSSGTDTLSIGRLTQIRDSLSPYNGGHTYFEYYRVRTL